MAEYIERSYIRKMAMFEMAYTMETETDAAVVLRMIDDAPAADVAPVVHGRWDENGYCVNCGRHAPFLSISFCCYKSKYCPNCGTKMDGGEENG